MKKTLYILELGTLGRQPKVLEKIEERIKEWENCEVCKVLIFEPAKLDRYKELAGMPDANQVIRMDGDIALREPLEIPEDFAGEVYEFIEEFDGTESEISAEWKQYRSVRLENSAKLIKLFRLWDMDELDFRQQFHPHLKGGHREIPAQETLSVGAIVSIATKEVAGDLFSLIASVAHYMPGIPLHLVVDDKAGDIAAGICARLQYDDCKIHRWITAESLAAASKKSGANLSHADYWKTGPIWWKLEGLRRILAKYKDSRGVLLVDSDITFCAPVTETFRGVDAVLSPFYWPDPDLPTQMHGKTVGIARRDGWYNAGYILAGCEAVAKTWLRLYEAGTGFYEQKCMHYLPQKYQVAEFDRRHNWGQWRNQIPGDELVSIHCHTGAGYRAPHAAILEDRLNQEIEKLESIFPITGPAE